MDLAQLTGRGDYRKTELTRHGAPVSLGLAELVAALKPRLAAKDIVLAEQKTER